MVLQVRRHGSEHHRGEDLRLDLLSQRRAGDRPAGAGHRVQLQPNLPPEPESGQDESAAGQTRGSVQFEVQSVDYSFKEGPEQ